jgi:hypothetical protein
MREQISSWKLPVISKTGLLASCLLSLCIISSCINPPEYPEEPFLTFLTVSSTLLNEGEGDSLFIQFGFEDGDGDLGNGDPEDEPADTTTNIFVEDSRVPGFPIGYHIDSLISLSNVPAISGDIRIDFGSNFFSCLGEESMDTFSLAVWIIDRKGNVSNLLRTPVININCE